MDNQSPPTLIVMKTTTLPTAEARTKRFASVQDLVKATAADEKQVREFDRLTKDTVIVNALIRSRAAVGMTQADVAKIMNCTQSAVSKLEHAADAELTLQEIASYLTATGGRLNLGIGKPTTRIERIKDLAISLEQELRNLAKQNSNSDDQNIRQNITSFFGETWFNFFKILCDATSKLPMEDDDKTLEVTTS
jgi:transcriptional regulator with XRE-family HTH domain